MRARQNLSAGLIGIGLILAFLPYNGNKSLTENAAKVAIGVFDENAYFTIDEVARMIVNEDSTLRLIDLRSPDQFDSFSLPGAVNIPYEQFISKDPSVALTRDDTKNVLYSNGDIEASYALVVARGMKFDNVYVMKGGMNQWFPEIMESRFTGERLTARENAIFEVKYRAAKLFTEINSLPDSLKATLYASKKLEAKKLDGGCE